MPFKSEAQRKFMWAKHPDIAKKWADEMQSKGEPQIQQTKKSFKKAAHGKKSRTRK